MNTKPDNAPRELVHHDQNPMCAQGCGFAGTVRELLGGVELT